MQRQFTPRHILTAYTFAGLVIGTAVSVWLFRDSLDRYYVHSDGSLSRSSDRQEWQYDDKSTKYHTVTIIDGRPLTTVEKIFVGARESFLLWMSSALVGLFWGIVHLRLRADFSNLHDQNRLDYCDSITSNFPPGSS